MIWILFIRADAQNMIRAALELEKLWAQRRAGQGQPTMHIHALLSSSDKPAAPPPALKPFPQAASAVADGVPKALLASSGSRIASSAAVFVLLTERSAALCFVY